VALCPLDGPDEKLGGMGGYFFKFAFKKDIVYNSKSPSGTEAMRTPSFCSLLQAYFIFSRMVQGNFKFLSGTLCKNWEICKAFMFFV
jgi:hypothetical protein